MSRKILILHHMMCAKRRWRLEIIESVNRPTERWTGKGEGKRREMICECLFVSLTWNQLETEKKETLTEWRKWQTVERFECISLSLWQFVILFVSVSVSARATETQESGRTQNLDMFWTRLVNYIHSHREVAIMILEGRTRTGAIHGQNTA